MINSRALLCIVGASLLSILAVLGEFLFSLDDFSQFRGSKRSSFELPLIVRYLGTLFYRGIAISLKYFTYFARKTFTGFTLSPFLKIIPVFPPFSRKFHYFCLWLNYFWLHSLLLYFRVRNNLLWLKCLLFC